MSTKLIYTLIILTLGIIGLGFNIAKHGEPKETKHNWWASLIAQLIFYFLYYKAGLFDVFFNL